MVYDIWHSSLPVAQQLVAVSCGLWHTYVRSSFAWSCSCKDGVGERVVSGGMDMRPVRRAASHRDVNVNVNANGVCVWGTDGRVFW